jgi:hypothetical protein
MQKTLVMASVIAVLAGAAPAMAAEPLFFKTFDIGAAKSLPWGDPSNFIGKRDDYDFHRVIGDTEALLTPSMPTIVRMETLRRAVLYSSRHRPVAEALVAFVMGRVKNGKDALASFDAGFVVETLKQLQQYGADGKVYMDRDVLGMTLPSNGRALLDQSAALRPNDGSIQLALALLVPPNDAEPYLRKARSGAREDSMLSNNLAKFQLLQ